MLPNQLIHAFHVAITTEITVVKMKMKVMMIMVVMNVQMEVEEGGDDNNSGSGSGKYVEGGWCVCWWWYLNWMQLSITLFQTKSYTIKELFSYLAPSSWFLLQQYPAFLEELPPPPPDTLSKLDFFLFAKFGLHWCSVMCIYI